MEIRKALIVWITTASATVQVLAGLLESGVRGVATRAPEAMKIDGDLSEFAAAFATPLSYFHPDQKNRPAQFLYMWDHEAFYAGLRTLDEPNKQANHAPYDRLWEGDGVEWYFDTRRGDDFRSIDWGKGAVHCYWAGLAGTKVQPRFCLRPGYLDAIPKIGIEVGARRTEHGMEVEFKLPWANFPGFKAALNEVIALDAELCYSDGKERIDRGFVFGSPLSVQQPASQAKIQLVENFEPAHWKACGPVLMPMRVDTPWTQKTLAHCYGSIALPINHAAHVGRVVFRITGLDGTVLGEFPAEDKKIIQASGNFARLGAHWPSDLATPGAHHVTAIVYNKEGRQLTQIAPRLTSVGWEQGY